MGKLPYTILSRTAEAETMEGGVTFVKTFNNRVSMSTHVTEEFPPIPCSSIGIKIFPHIPYIPHIPHIPLL